MFYDFCGKDVFLVVILFIIRWDYVKDERIGVMCEWELWRSFWKDMIDYGVNV